MNEFVRNIFWTVADPGGAVWGNCPPKWLLLPLKVAPQWYNMRLFSVAIEVKTKTKITQSKLHNALHFVELRFIHDGLWPSLLPTRLQSTMLLFRNKTPVPLFLFRMKTAQQSQTRSLLFATEFWTWATAEIFPRGGNVNILLLLARLLTMQCECMFTKRFTISTRQHHKNTHVTTIYSQNCASLAAITRYITIIFTIGYLQIFKEWYFFSQKFCHGL